MTPPEADFTLGAAAGMAVGVAAMVFTIFNQIKGIIAAPENPCVYNSFVKMSSTDVLWTCLFFKECFFVTVPLFYLVLYSVFGVIMLVLSPVKAIYYSTMVKGKGPGAELAYASLNKAISDAVAQQANLNGSLLLNLSTTFRCCVILQQLLSRKVSVVCVCVCVQREKREIDKESGGPCQEAVRESGRRGGQTLEFCGRSHTYVLLTSIAGYRQMRRSKTSDKL